MRINNPLIFLLILISADSYLTSAFSQPITAAVEIPEKITIEPDTIEQGGLATIQIPKDSTVIRTEIICGQDTLSLIERGNLWLAFWAPDLNAKTGQYQFRIILEKNDGQKQVFYRTIFVKKIEAPTKKLTVSPRFIELDSATLERIKQEKMRISRVYRSETEIAWQNSFILPLDSATAGNQFGEKRIFNGKIASVHNGVDFGALEGDSIRATNDGQIVLAGDFFFEGKLVVIDHGGKLFTFYCHLSKILVQEGQMIKRGEIIGLVGSTGRATGPHLHWGSRLGRARINPLDLLRLPNLK